MIAPVQDVTQTPRDSAWVPVVKRVRFNRKPQYITITPSQGNILVAMQPVHPSVAKRATVIAVVAVLVLLQGAK